MFFPIRTDRQPKSTPWVNYALIALNVVVYAFTWQSTQQFGAAVAGGYSLQEAFRDIPGVGLWLWPDESLIRLPQFLTYQFVHSGPEPVPVLPILLPLHLIFNMLFLYVFGNAVEDRLGKLGYLAFYLAGGTLAGLAHIVDPTAGPVLGASGSVAAVTGAYLALFPMSNVTIAYWLVVFVGSFVVSSVVLILFRVVMDLIFQLSGIGRVAYLAHLGGYLYGFVVGMGLLMLRLLPREPYDMLALIEQRRRRAAFRKLSRQGFEPWENTRPGDPPKPGRPAAAPNDEDQALMQRRADIADAAGRRDLPAAAERYANLLTDHPDQVLPQTTQLDVANQLMADGRYDTAARAYELFLSAYRDYAARGQVQLILGLIYARYLNRPERAAELLADAKPRLAGDDAALADPALAELACPPFPTAPPPRA
ncbi:MAG: rhomboid family intramembrane serine protease [Planctomycetota bacterium]